MTKKFFWWLSRDACVRFSRVIDTKDQVKNICWLVHCLPGQVLLDRPRTISSKTHAPNPFSGIGLRDALGSAASLHRWVEFLYNSICGSSTMHFHSGHGQNVRKNILLPGIGWVSDFELSAECRTNYSETPIYKYLLWLPPFVGSGRPSWNITLAPQNF